MEFVGALEAPQSSFENFGRRLTGWLVHKESADYVFYICSDDDSLLSLSSDESPRNLAEIARLNGYKLTRRWEELDESSISRPIRLEAGRRYFIEVLHKDGIGGDHVSIAWRKADEPALKNGDHPIGGEFLARPARTPTAEEQQMAAARAHAALEQLDRLAEAQSPPPRQSLPDARATPSHISSPCLPPSRRTRCSR